MPIVVSDTSPVRALSQLGMLDLLRVQFGKVIVPPAVAKELAAGSQFLPPVDIGPHAFVSVVEPASTEAVQRADPELHRGEVEAISLAIELHADRLLIDEADGRRIAERFRLHVVGVLGILVEAKRTGSIDAVKPLLTRLRSDARFYVSDSLAQRILSLAGEA